MIPLPRPGGPIRLALLLALGALAAPAEGQTPGRRAGLGFVVSAPHQFRGFSAHLFPGGMGGLGVYVDAKFDIDSPTEEATFLPDVTVRQVEDEFGDQFFNQENSWRSFNAALMRPLTPELTLYLGAGYSRRRIFREYIDARRERGVLGIYWVEDPDRAAGTVNVLGGGLFRIGRALALQFGVESQPTGGTVGATFSVPF